MMKFTKKQKQKGKYTVCLCAVILVISYGSYYVGKNELSVDIAKKQLGVKKSPVQDISKDEDLYVENTSQFEPISFVSLPVGIDFGTPVSLGGSSFTYSDLKGLEIQQGILSDMKITCSNITEFLAAKLDTWYYWNTCRSIGSYDDGISFYVIRLSEDKSEYIYEKHYVLYQKNLYGVYELQNGLSVNQDDIRMDIQAYNTRLKEQNPENGGTEFPVVSVVDSLFKKILK